MPKNLLILLLFLSPFCMNSQNIIWKTDINDAVTASAEKRKPLLIFFTAQGVNSQLQNEIFATRDFEEWSRKNVILVKLDLSDPSASDAVKEQNLMLKNAFGIEDIPQVCFSEVTVRKGKTSFNKLGLIAYKASGVKNWISESNSIINPE
ncbi:MAG: thioredoxin family protein [Flavobacterium nitrogenifigens]|uniref:thioredoxin family protein n=1 Tax=Flavobacterium nitrogenifigens TaxID=1617283 RepID=UPI0028073DAB|nr:thioredoxin family protein [Flavobacterium nitrogenifigens]MDQ8011468.1 thioredoxin family protein [Flavobacterium nitrogenifigens]